MTRRRGTAAEGGPSPIAQRRRAALVLACALALPACGAVQTAERNLRRIDILDRVFEPERFRPPPPPEPALPVVRAEPLLPPPDETGTDSPPQPAYGEPAPITQAAVPAMEPLPDPAPRPDPAPPRDPAIRRAALLREYPWLARFWGELAPAQQGRVSRAMRRAGDPDATGDPTRWDRMGLADRVRLVFGGA